MYKFTENIFVMLPFSKTDKTRDYVGVVYLISDRTLFMSYL